MSVTDNERVLDRLIIGRVTPRIYAFTTNTVPNYLKVGDTYRPVAVRLHEWARHFPNLRKQFEGEATISEDVYFRDLAVHRFLEKDLGKERLQEKQLPQGVYYSREFFRETDVEDIESAIESIKRDYADHGGRYDFYDANSQLPQPFTYTRGDSWVPRPNQQEAIKNFKIACEAGRSNLLMYAVMRFGKSFTSLCCAKEISAKTVLIVSAKADVKSEWKKTVEVAGNFEGWHFIDSEALIRNELILEEIHHDGGTAVIFLTLQDLQGKELKAKHHPVFASNIDLLIIDETHFGARAEEYGRVLRDAGQPTDPVSKKNPDRDDEIDPDLLETHVKQLKARVKLHLSGTPYRILMGSEFSAEDIISFVQFSDIVREQQEWDREHLDDEKMNEWDNPYFGFPQMIRFAFNPNESSRKKMEELREQGYSFAMSKLLEPESMKFDKIGGRHKQFKNEPEILDLLRVIDGTKDDNNVLGFLDYDKLRDGKMCRHMVIVLPYRASCDALEKLIADHVDEFRNLGNYRIINISGLESGKVFPTSDDVKRAIASAESADQKTITLTVNRMLTGSTVEQWDTMLFLKDTSSPQEYDQAVFRLQNQYTRTLVGSDGKTIKESLKPQTLLVDLDPDRLFHMQEQKSLIYNVNTDANGNDKLEERLRDEVNISPIITINAGKIHEVEPTDILSAISNYNKDRSVADEARDVPPDLNVLKNQNILQVILQQAEIGSRGGLTIKPNSGEEDDLEPGVDENEDGEEQAPGDENEYDEDVLDNLGKADKTDIRSLEKKLQTYYQRILFYAMLTNDNVRSLAEIVATIGTTENQRIARNLGLDVNILQQLLHSFDPFKLSALDYKIQNISQLSQEESLTPVERVSRALAKFTRLSDSEVRTPSWLCEEMVSEIPRDQLKSCIESGEKILDIGSKSGEFAFAFYQLLTGPLNLKQEQVENAIYSIPTSSISYEFTRKFYEILGLNTDNIAAQFTAYELPKVQTKSGQIDYGYIAHVLTQNKCLSSIRLDGQLEEGENPVRFGAVVGNPPYQEGDGGAGRSSRPIYQKFVNLAIALDPQFCSFVIPSRWYGGGKGPELRQFRSEMLSNTHVSQLHDFLNPETVFPDTNNRGGVCYFLIDRSYDATLQGGTVIYTHDANGNVKESVRPLNSFSAGYFIRDSIGVEIVEKIINNPRFSSLSDHVSAAKAFGFRTFFIKDSRFRSTARGLTDPITCYGRTNKVGFVERAEIYSNTDWIDRWKVFVPESNNIGTELIDDNQNAFVGAPGSVCTETFLVVGADLQLDKTTASRLEKYLKTKFARFLHAQAKVSQHGTKQTYRFVPVPPLTDETLVDWDLPSDELSQELAMLYGLAPTEISHINASIKEERRR